MLRRCVVRAVRTAYDSQPTLHCTVYCSCFGPCCMQYYAVNPLPCFMPWQYDLFVVTLQPGGMSSAVCFWPKTGRGAVLSVADDVWSRRPFPLPPSLHEPDIDSLQSTSAGVRRQFRPLFVHRMCHGLNVHFHHFQRC